MVHEETFLDEVSKPGVSWTEARKRALKKEHHGMSKKEISEYEGRLSGLERRLKEQPGLSKMKPEELALLFEENFNRKNLSGGIKDMRIRVEDKSRIRVTFLDRQQDEVGHAFVDSFGRLAVQGSLPYNTRWELENTLKKMGFNLEEVTKI